jgi:hypothetical protein
MEIMSMGNYSQVQQQRLNVSYQLPVLQQVDVMQIVDIERVVNCEGEYSILMIDPTYNYSERYIAGAIGGDNG